MLRISALVLSSVVPEIRRQPESHVEVSRLFLFFSLFAGSKFIAFTPQDRQPPLSPFVCHVALPSWNVSPFGHGLHHNIVDNSCYCFFFWERRKNFWTLPSRLFKNKNETIAGSTGDAAYVRRPTRQNKMKCWRAERERHWGKHDARRDLDSTALERNRKWLVASLFCGNLAGGNRYDCYNLLLKRKARGK